METEMKKPRSIIPEKGNPYYNRKASGGYSPCVKGNYPFNVNEKLRTGRPGMDVLSNCVGWATGVFNEYSDEGCIKYLGSTNAELFMRMAEKQGLKTGFTPKPCAVMVWKGGNSYEGADGAGHVAIVVEAYSLTHVLTSESGWNYNGIMWRQNRYRGNGRWGQNTSYSFLGFIYHPDVVFEFCPYPEPTKAFKKGAKGTNVRWLQWHLNWEGYDLDIDGSFGPLTDKAVRDFQARFNNSIADGWVGPTTRKLLKEHLPWEE